MSVVFKNDHEQEGLDLLLAQFQDRELLAELIKAFLIQIQELEDVNASLMTEPIIDSSSGDQLDVLGRIVGQPRDGRTDEIYRLWIKARIQLNRSSGTAEEILNLVRLITGLADSEVRISDYYPAAFIVWELVDSGVDPDTILELINLARGAGIEVHLGYPVTPDNFFQFTQIGGVSGSSYSEIGGANGGVMTAII